MRYIVAKAYDVDYAKKLVALYTKLYGVTLETEKSRYCIDSVIYDEFRIYAHETYLHYVHGIRKTLWHLHGIYGHGEKLEII